MLCKKRMISKLPFLMTCVILWLDQTQGVTSHVDDLSDLLHDMIGVLESRQEKLEAATENFRVRASTLNGELVQERSKCNQLEHRIVENEYIYKDELSSWRVRAEAAESEFGHMESKYQNQLWNEKAKACYLEHKLQQKDIEVFDLREQLAALRHSTTKKIIPDELAPTIQDENQKQQQLMPDIFPGTSFTPESISSTLTPEESPGLRGKVLFVANTMALLATNGLKYLRDDLAPRAGHFCSQLAKSAWTESFRSYQKLKMLLSWMCEHSKSCYRGVMRTIHEIKTPGVRVILIRIIKLLSKVSDRISTMFSRAWDELWRCLSSHLNATQIQLFLNATRSLQTIHQLVVVMFESLAVASSKYFITELSGNRDHWFYKTCISAKLNSGSMLVMLEVFAGLVAMELALLALHRTRRSRLQELKKQRGRHISVSTSEKPSLLRSAGCIGNSDNSFRSLMSPSLD